MRLRLHVLLLCLCWHWPMVAEGRSADDAATITGCDDHDTDSLIKAIEAELASLRAQPAEPRVTHERLKLSNHDYVERMLLPIQTAAKLGKAALCRVLNKRIKLLPLAHRAAHVTAYYHPVLRGSRTPHGPYQIPLYRRPTDESLAQQTTGAVLSGALTGHQLELVYVESLAQALHIHIEGSATISLDDGNEINLTTDGHNGHPYQNPLRLLVRDHRIPNDFPTEPGQSKTQAFIKAHPEVLREYWGKNPHFVFFEITSPTTVAK